MKKRKSLSLSILCRQLAYRAGQLACEIYAEEDAPPYDGRVVANKERALARVLEKLEELSGVPVDKLRPLPNRWSLPYEKYLEAYREAGVPIATNEEVLKL